MAKKRKAKITKTKWVTIRVPVSKVLEYKASQKKK